MVVNRFDSTIVQSAMFCTAAKLFSAADTVVLAALPFLKPAVTFFEAAVSGFVRGLY